MLTGFVTELTGLDTQNEKIYRIKGFFSIFLLSVIQKVWNVGSKNALYPKRNCQFDHVIKKCTMYMQLVLVLCIFIGKMETENCFEALFQFLKSHGFVKIVFQASLCFCRCYTQMETQRALPCTLTFHTDECA